ncbi:papilin-like [Ostrea edulis]|uniref:papilin-like n=1 Tax=Ostrea edulis TaxID=37623 RepID=UPI0024AFE48B|nr:papilin-like [Ostrea edulis]
MLGKVIVLFFVASACAQYDPPRPRPPSQEKPGSCPKSDIITTCDCDRRNIQCNVDGECPGDQKCCSYGCGCRTRCVSPEKKRVCTYNGKVYTPGQSFPSTDGCNTCTCRSNGHVTCTRMTCNEPPVLDVCSQPQVTGPCRASVRRWWYNSKTNRCEKFTYGGCQGNENNFETRWACRGRCQRNSFSFNQLSSTMLGKIIVLFFVASACAQYDPPRPHPPSLEKPGSCPKSDIITTCECDPRNIKCNGDGECPGDQKCCSYGCGCRRRCVAPEGTLTRVCKYNGKLYKPGQGFPSSDGCNRCTCGSNGFVSCTKRACIKPPVLDVCSQPKVTGPCRAAFRRWWYNSKTNRCEKFTYGGCRGNKNNFKTEWACRGRCQRRSCEYIRISLVVLFDAPLTSSYNTENHRDATIQNATQRTTETPRSKNATKMWCTNPEALC